MRIVVHRTARRVLVMVGPLGLTVWRRGAISLQVRGHFVQVVLGDWWQAT